MKTSYRMSLASSLAMLALGAALPAFGQYVWTDERGVRQYSDRPPPPSIPASRILKQPGGIRQQDAPDARESNSAAAAIPSASDAGDNSAKKPSQSLAERNAEYQKRRIEAAEQEKKKADQEADAASRARNCDRIRGYQKSLESGGRMARLDKNGERTYLSEEQVQQELRETREMAARCS